MSLLPAVLLAAALALTTLACGTSSSDAPDGGPPDGATPPGATTEDAAVDDAAGDATGSQGPQDAASDAGGSDARNDGADASSCVPSCGQAKCGDDGCGGSCGQCTGTDYCGGGGVAGTCGSGPVGGYPGVHPTQVDKGIALGLRVASDERHVLVQRAETARGDQAALAVVTLDASGSGSTRELSSAVDFINGIPRADFTADGAALYFVDGAQTTRRLMAAAADGSGLRTLASGVIQDAIVGGTTLVYMIDVSTTTGDRSVYAVSLPSGTPVQLVAAGTVNYPELRVSPNGSAVFVTDEGGRTVHELVRTADGKVTPLGPAGTEVRGVWSPDGAHFAYWFEAASAVTVRVVNADGTGDTLLASDSLTGMAPAFSPGGTLLATTRRRADGDTGAIVVHPVNGGADAVLTLDPAHSWGPLLRFSPDGRRIAITSFDGSALDVAATDHSGAFVEIAPHVALTGLEPYACEWSAGHDFVSFLLSNRRLSVAPTAGGSAHIAAAPIDQPGFFEPVVAHPGLLAFTSTNPTQSRVFGSLALFGSDGSGAATMLPGKVMPAFTTAQEYHSPRSGWQGADDGGGQSAETFTWGWLGSEIVYESRDADHAWFDVVAATDTAGTVGVIAPGTEVWAVRDGATPSRVFFTRPSFGGGVWWSPVPQTPGR